LTRVLQHTGGKQVQAVRLLGITRGSLRTKIHDDAPPWCSEFRAQCPDALHVYKCSTNFSAARTRRPAATFFGCISLAGACILGTSEPAAQERWRPRRREPSDSKPSNAGKAGRPWKGPLCLAVKS